VEKHIITWSYWLGLLSALIAFVLRGCNAFGILLPAALKQGETIWYMSFYKGALLLFLIAIATANYTWARTQKPI